MLKFVIVGDRFCIDECYIFVIFEFVVKYLEFGSYGDVSLMM